MNDIDIRSVGPMSSVVIGIANCTDEVAQILERELLIIVSRRQALSSQGKCKTIATASSPLLARRKLTSMRRLGIVVAREATHLGVHVGLGKRTKDLRGKLSRWQVNAQSKARTIWLGKRLGSRIVKMRLKAQSATTAEAMRRAPGRPSG